MFIFFTLQNVHGGTGSRIALLQYGLRKEIVNWFAFQHESGLQFSMRVVCISV